MKRCILALGLVLLLGTGGEARPPLGLNLAGIRDYSTEIVFVDAFKAARAWISQARGKPWGQGGPLELDDQGNVKRLRPGQYAETIVCTGFADRFPAGSYTCLYRGEGKLTFGGDARVTESKPGRLTVEVTPRNGQITARVEETNPDNPVRNIRLIMPGFEDTYLEQPFHPSFLQRWQGFKVFRFMDWGSTNNSRIVEWSDRPTADLHSQALKGVAVEYMMRLSNHLGVEPWLCIPHAASDDYVRQLARLVKEQLKPQLQVYLEYSNECWNGQFEQARYCLRQGQKLGLSDNAYQAQLRYYSQRSVEIFRIWEEVLGKERLVRVLATQSANPWTGSTVLEWKEAVKHADAVAIAPYFGHRWGSPRMAEETARMTPDQLIQALPEDLAQSRKQMLAYAELAKKHGVKLFAYEGGQHLVGHGGAENNEKLTQLFHSVNRHPGMKDLYQQNLQSWQEAGGDLFCVFSSMGRYSKWGSWGVLEHTGQDISEAPKLQAIRAYLAGKE